MIIYTVTASSSIPHREESFEMEVTTCHLKAVSIGKFFNLQGYEDIKIKEWDLTSGISSDFPAIYY